VSLEFKIVKKDWENVFEQDAAYVAKKSAFILIVWLIATGFIIKLFQVFAFHLLLESIFGG
jgi:hypothetical protein